MAPEFSSLNVLMDYKAHNPPVNVVPLVDGLQREDGLCNVEPRLLERQDVLAHQQRLKWHASVSCGAQLAVHDRMTRV